MVAAPTTRPDRTDGVALLRWPGEAERRAALAADGCARLLLVDDRTAPPELWDALEDWMRVPGDPVELYERRRVLERRQASRSPAVVDDDGLLRRGSTWVALSPKETILVRLLLDRQGSTVSRQTLLDAVGSAVASTGSRLLDRVVHRLRNRIRPLHISIHTVRGAGFVLVIDDLA
jgi:DNA-binding response OmpR family regulator